MKFTRPLTLCLILSSSPVWAWGERGHDGVTRVAARIVADSKDPETARFGNFLLNRENMLGHLANVPDIVWRNVSPELDKVSSPSHFIDFDYIVGPGKLPTAEQLPANIDALEKAVQKNCGKKGLACAPGNTAEEKLQKVGHAPFRIESLTQDLAQAFKDLKALEQNKADEKQKNPLVERILLLSGILSHFVGDLANPHHTSADYDGWDSGQGGLHGYFESEIVSSLGLELEATVLEEAQRHPAMAERFAKHPRQYLLQAWELVLESHEQLPVLVTLDKDHSLLEKSIASPDRDKRQKAKRKDVRDTRNIFRNFIILRLATGADALSRFWVAAWQEGGKPDLSFYRGYHYDVKPEFVPLRYMPKASLKVAPSTP